MSSVISSCGVSQRLIISPTVKCYTLGGIKALFVSLPASLSLPPSQLSLSLSPSFSLSLISFSLSLFLSLPPSLWFSPPLSPSLSPPSLT